MHLSLGSLRSIQHDVDLERLCFDGVIHIITSLQRRIRIMLQNQKEIIHIRWTRG